MLESPKPSNGAEYRAGIRTNLGEIKGQMREIKGQGRRFGCCPFVV